ncbi:amino acid adenylation domain-containing protein [Calothrix sp. CCY 0018]|uniref:amino acid adenylation domain-containing protein n=1 Tax=Calothrix sp. CCY 0018 TaxID=3103864 RepID=UPI0039C5FCD9
MLNLSIANLIKRQAEKNPSAICIATPNRKALTYGSLYSCIEDVGAHLQAMGLGRNSRVAIALPNGSEMAVAFLAVASFCTCAPLNPNYRAVEFDFYLSDLQAKALIVQSGINSEAIAVAQARGIPILELSPILDAEAGIFTFPGANKDNIFSGFACADDIALVLHTSGTTARPKIVPLTHANLCTSANNIQIALKLSEDDCCLNVMPLFHIHGLIGTLLSSLFSGGSVVCTPGFDGTKFFEWLLEFKPTWYSAVPTIHQAILAEANASWDINNCSIRLIRSSSAALPPQVAIALEEIFNAPVIEAYGMTEASHQMASNPLPPAVRKPGSVGVPTGIEIAIMDELGNLLEPGAVGEIVIQGANVTSGYENPQANVSAFTNGWFRTGDNGYFDGDGYLYIKGRIKEIINRGGEKISPREVDEVLLNHPAVQQAVTFAVPHPTLGEDVAAAVVLQKNETVTEKEIYEFAFSRLADFKLPTQVVFVDEIPKGATGKLQRIGLAEKLASQLKVAYVKPRNEIEKTLVAIWIEVLGIETVGIYDNFFEKGGDSLRASQVIARMETMFQVEVSVHDFFAAPTIINLSQILNLAAKNIKEACKQIIPQNRDRPLPLSGAQQYLWFLSQLAPDSPVYNVANAMQIQGNLNVEFVKQAINAIVERHALLRSTIRLLNGQLVQIIGSHKIVVEQIALDIDSSKRFIDEEIQRPFDLEQGPLLRVTLLQLEPAKYLLLLVNHHIISDDWSIGLFWQEFTAFYEAFSTKQPFILQLLPIQYADFAVWQRNYLQGEFLQSQLDYWKQQLKGELPLLQLPTDYVRPAVQTFRGANLSLTISKSLTEELKNLSKSEGVTIFMTLLAAFKTLLYCYSNQEDILIITPISERDRVETEQIIGCFANNLILRTNLNGNPSFKSLLQRVKKTAIEAYTHRHLPFDKLIEELQIERYTNKLPFQVMFILHNAPKSALLNLPELTLTPLSIHTATAQLDLTLELQETAQGITGRLEYNTDLFDAATISRMVEHFQILLDGIIANPYQSISKLPLLTQKEQHQLLVEWNNTKTNYPDYICIHQLFEQQVKRTPEAIAVVFGKQQVTYQQLNASSNQLAHYLQKLGVKPEGLVAICLERSIEMVVGLLGILKVGGAYVPIDPNYPQERITYMLEDSQVSVLLTQDSLIENLPMHPVHTIALDTDWEKIAQNSDRNLDLQINLENLAYVIYTSGSTGKPKGAMNTHRGICNRLLWMRDAYNFTQQDVVMQKTPFSFDVSVWEFFIPLIVGASLVVAKPEGHYDNCYLIDTINHKKITALHFVPSMLGMFLETEGVECCSSLKYVFCSGEALPLDLQTKFFQKLGCKLYNLYGPTEVAIEVTFWQCQLNTKLSNVPIGRPINNIQIYILDAYKQPVPIGVPGELYIGGDGLARGYLNRPQLTQEKFIPHPFSQDDTRLYKTGDLVRYLADGNIEFLGRIDNQVKMRGIRIELGEIETVLAQHKSVISAAVVAPEYLSRQILVAYIVQQQQSKVNSDELRQFLAQKLPEYMIPNLFVTLETLPLTPNGKIDRRSLPAVSETSLQPKLVYCSPQNQKEREIANIWEKVLGINPVSINDNFFELGGNSLLAVRLVAQIEKQLGKKLPISTLFQNSTIKQLATCLQQEKLNASSVVEITPLNGDVSPLFWCTPHLNYKLNLLGKYIGTSQPLIALDCGYFKLENPDTHITDYAIRYVEEIRAIQPNGPYKLAGYCMGGLIAFEIAQQIRVQGEQVDLVLVERSGLNRIHRYVVRINVLIDGHRNNLAQLNRTQQLIYIFKFVKKILIRSLLKSKQNENQQEPDLNTSGINNTLLQQKGLKSVKKYSLQQPYPGNIILLFAKSNNYLSFFFPKYGWSKAVNGKIQIDLVPGNHVSVMEEPHIQQVGAKLKSYLNSKN